MMGLSAMMVAAEPRKPARASAPPSAFEFFQPPKYRQPGPSATEGPGNTKTGHLLDHGARFRKGWGFQKVLYVRGGDYGSGIGEGDWDVDTRCGEDSPPRSSTRNNTPPGQGSITLLRTLVFVHRPPSVVALFRGDVGLLLCGVNRA